MAAYCTYFGAKCVPNGSIKAALEEITYHKRMNKRNTTVGSREIIQALRATRETVPPTKNTKEIAILRNHKLVGASKVQAQEADQNRVSRRKAPILVEGHCQFQDNRSLVHEKEKERER